MEQPAEKQPLELWTIGHSTRPIGDFLDMLKSFEIEMLADVRSYPGSRRFPQFNKESLRKSLESCGIKYIHMPALGGRRPAANDENIHAKSMAFTGFIEYMKNGEFREGIAELINLSASLKAAIMCSESDWRKCHRSKIADYLKYQGIKIYHITAENEAEDHHYTSGIGQEKLEL